MLVLSVSCWTPRPYEKTADGSPSCVTTAMCVGKDLFRRGGNLQPLIFTVVQLYHCVGCVNSTTASQTALSSPKPSSWMWLLQPVVVVVQPVASGKYAISPHCRQRNAWRKMSARLSCATFVLLFFCWQNATVQPFYEPMEFQIQTLKIAIVPVYQCENRLVLSVMPDINIRKWNLWKWWWSYQVISHHLLTT